MLQGEVEGEQGIPQPMALLLPGLERCSPAKFTRRSSCAFWERVRRAPGRILRLCSVLYGKDINEYE